MFNEEFFKLLGFEREGENAYRKDVITQTININGQLYGLEEKLQFKVYETSEDLGVNIEHYRNGRLALSGYYHSEQDFKTEFS